MINWLCSIGKCFSSVLPDLDLVRVNHLPQAQLAKKTTLLSEARLKEQGFVEKVSV